MSSTSGTPVKQIPAFPLISQRLMGYSWKSLGMEEYQEETTRKWLEEAYRADIQAAKNVSEPETLPRSLLAGLYPEVVAFGVNGTKVAQAFQFFLQLNKHLGEGKKSFPAQKAFGRFIKEVTGPLWGFDPDSARGFFGKIHDDIEFQKIMVCGSNVTKQRMNRGLPTEVAL